MTTSKSLMENFLTQELRAKYKEVTTFHGWNIEKAIRSGKENTDSAIGVYAGDEECYTLWEEWFNPIIEKCHAYQTSSQHRSSWKKTGYLHNPDPEGNYIKSTRIRVARNIKNKPFPAAMTLKDRLAIEQMVAQALKEQTAIRGEYYSLTHLPEEAQVRLQALNSMMRQGDRFMESAGFNKDWPQGRGIFFNPQMNLIIWIGEEDLFRIISLEKSGDFNAVFDLLASTHRTLDELLSFSSSRRYGFLTSCPSNIGTGMRASVHIYLPNLSQNKKKLKQICNEMDLQVRGTQGEHTRVDGNVYDISNRRRLGISEFQIISALYEGTKHLITLEQENNG